MEELCSDEELGDTDTDNHRSCDRVDTTVHISDQILYSIVTSLVLQESEL